MIKKLILGTAGLSGILYGRNERTVHENEAKRIIERAYNAGIRTFDTAPAYGKAEKWLGEALGNRTAVVYTKTDGDKAKARLSLNHYYSKISPQYLWHQYDNQPTPAWIGGASIYSADVKDKIIEPRFTVQMDWNLLNQARFPKCGKRIARSVFLQGILAGEKCPKGLGAAVASARIYAKLRMMELSDLALRAALQNRDIDHVIIGPTSIEELNTCIQVANSEEVPIGDITGLHVGGTLTDARTWS